MTHEKKQQIQNAYDEIATTYHTETSENDDGMDESILADFASSLSENATIFDAGCGGDPVQIPNTRTVGLDISQGQLSKYTGTTAHLLQGDMTELPFEDNVFDGATAFYSLIHIPLEDHQTVINELFRVLKPDSPILLVEGTEEWVGSNESWLDTGEEMHWEMAGREATIQHLENAGFNIEQITPVRDTLGDADGTKYFFLARTNAGIE